MHDWLAVQSLCHHFSVHDRDVHKQEKNYEEIVHETQKAKKRFREDVKRRGQVGDCTDQAEKNSNPEHPEETTHCKHLPEGVTQQGGYIAQPVHKLSRSGETEYHRTLSHYLFINLFLRENVRKYTLTDTAFGISEHL